MVSWLRKLLGRDDRAGCDAMHDDRSEADTLADFRAMIARDVAAGFDPPAAILQNASDCFEDELPGALMREVGPVYLAEALAAHAAVQAGWARPTDNDRLDRAFAALEAAGVIARQHFSCCGTCGSSEIWDEIDAASKTGAPVRGYTFFHMQDTESAAEGDGLYLNYGAVEEGESAALAIGHEIVAALAAQRLTTDWDGSWDRRIHVALDWKRWRPSAEPWTSGTVH